MRFFLPVLIVLLFAGSRGYSQTTAYTISPNGETSVLYTIDLATGAKEKVFDIPIPNILGFAAQDTHTIYTVNYLQNDNKYHLNRVDIEEKTVEYILSLGGGAIPIFFDPAGKLIVKAYGDDAVPGFYEVNLEQKTLSPYLPLLHSNLSLTWFFNPVDWSLWGCNPLIGELYKVAYGATTLEFVGQIGGLKVYQNLTSLDFDSQGNLYATSDDDGNMVLNSIDLETLKLEKAGTPEDNQPLVGLHIIEPATVDQGLILSKYSVVFNMYGEVKEDSANLYIINKSDQAITIDEVKSAGSPFDVNQLPGVPFEIPAKGSQKIDVHFAPADLSVSTGEVVITWSLNGTPNELKATLRSENSEVKKIPDFGFYSYNASTHSLKAADKYFRSSTEIVAADLLSWIQAVDNNRVLYTAHGFNVFMSGIDGSSKVPFFTAPMGLSDITFASGKLISAGALLGESAIYEYDPLNETARQILRKQLAGEITAITYDHISHTLYLATHNGRIYSLSIENPTEKLLYNFEKPISNLFTGEYGTIYFQTSSGEIYGLDRSSFEAHFIGYAALHEDFYFSYFPEDIAEPALLPSSSNINFGKAKTGEVNSRQVVIKNSGSSAATIGSYSVDGPLFSVAGLETLPVTLGPGEEKSIAVTYSSGELGTFNTFLHLREAEGSQPLVSIYLSAETFSTAKVLAGKIYALAARTITELLEIDPFSGEVLRAMRLSQSVSDIAINHEGYLYGCNGYDLYLIDPISGAFQFVQKIAASPGPNQYLADMVFGPEGILFYRVITNNQVPSLSKVEVFRYNMNSGESTLLYSSQNAGSLSYYDNKLYLGVNTVLDLADGSISSIPVAKNSMNLQIALVDANGQMYAAGSIPGDINNTQTSIQLVSRLSGRAKMLASVNYRLIAIDSYQLPVAENTIAVEPFEVLFPATEAGKSSTVEMTLSNVGNENVSVSSIELPIPFEAPADALPVDLAAGDSISLELHFEPETSGWYEGSILINFGEGKQFSVYISGLAVDIQTIQDGEVIGVSSYQTYNYHFDETTVDEYPFMTPIGVLSVEIDPSGRVFIATVFPVFGLYNLDPGSGQAFYYGTIDEISGDCMAFKADGRLYYLNNDGELFVYDLANKESERLGATGIAAPASMDLNPTNRHLGIITYANEEGNNYFYEVNPITFGVSEPVELDEAVKGIAYDITGTLWGFKSDGYHPVEFYTIDPTNGQMVSRGQYAVPGSLYEPILNSFDIALGQEVFTGVDHYDRPVDKLDVYPNPASNELFIEFEVNRAAKVDLVVSDLSGREVFNKSFSIYRSGTNKLTWDGRTNTGAIVPNGIYFVRLSEQGQQIAAKRIIYLR